MRVGYVALMALGSVVMWFGIPFGLIYLASKLSDSTQPSMGPYLLILFGLPTGMFAIGRLLGSLNRSYEERFMGGPQRYRPPWQRSMRAERDAGHKWTVLDMVMLYSVLTVLLLSAIWFFAFAGSPLPTV